MSRRTKLLIIGLFLVPLGIIVAHGILTWRPENPLRFRVVTIQGAPARFAEYTTQLGVHVENSSSATIYLKSAHILSRDGSDWGKGHHGFSEWAGEGVRVGEELEFISIPPHSSIRANLFVTEDRMEDAKAGRLSVRYFWISSTRDTMASACLWLYGHCPERFQSSLPTPPDYACDITPLHALAK